AGATAPPEATRNKAAIVDLRTGTRTVLPDVQSFALSKNGSHVALRRYGVTDRRGRGADLIVRDLEQGADLTFGNVSDFAWNDGGTLLAMAIDIDGRTGNGIQLLNVASGALRALDTGDQQYVGVAWRKHGDDLAVLRSRTDSAFTDTSYNIVAWRGLSSAQPTKTIYDFAAD